MSVQSASGSSAAGSAGSGGGSRSGSSASGSGADVALTTDLSLMPSTEVPGYNSLRVQKAYRINGIEAGRLDKQIQILERQKLHTVRLVNNDIRLTRVTLEHIEASSGRSVDQQGFLGSDASSSTNSINFAAVESGDKPMFLYGERKVSRRSGKFRRIQSAMGKAKSSSSNSDLPMGELAQRPKSSIPTFSEIKTRVLKQMEINPDWDPNTEPPYEDHKDGTDDERHKPLNAWMSEDRLTSAATTKTERPRTKSSKRSTVSWHISGTPPDGASVAEEPDDVINMVEQENLNNSDINIDNEKPSASITSKERQPDSTSHTKRRGSGSILVRRASASLHHTSSEQDKEELGSRESRNSINSPGETEEKPKTSTRKSRSQSAPKPRHPRDHPMAKVVGKTRALIGAAKKAQSSAAFWDPETSQQGSNMEKQNKRKAEKLAKSKGIQGVENKSTDSKVLAFLSSHPVAEEPEEVKNPLLDYGKVRNLLIDRQISLVSRLDLHSDDSIIQETMSHPVAC